MNKHLGGFAGSILHVNLTTREIRVESVDPEMAARFLGGLGLAIRLAHGRIHAETDPFDPDNPIILAAGPLVGTDMPSSSRIYAVTRLPATRTIGWCGAGGVNFGYLFKNAGYDHLIVTGRSETPVYLKIIDDRVEICDAAGLWGKGINAACEILWDQLGKPGGVLAIGPAGENRISFSMACVDRIATLGRGGFGAVMGSKNLKAIFVRGSRGIRVADPKKYRKIRDSLMEKIAEYPYLKEWQNLGMLKAFPMVSPELYRKIAKRRIACVSCPIGCKDLVEIPDGEFAGFTARSSSAVNLFTPLMYGVKDYRQAVRLISELDDYGMDMFEFFGLIGFARTLCEHGVMALNPGDPEFDLSNPAALRQWVRMIGSRQGSGDCFSGGFHGLFEHFGADARQHAPALVKSMHPYTGPGSALAWDLFGTMELGQVLDPRGPHVGSGGSPTYFAKRPLDVFPKHLERMGVDREAIARILPETDADAENPVLRVGALLKYSHQWFSILGSLGICARGQVNRFYNADLCARIYEAVTGIPTDLEALRRRADRVWSLYRIINTRLGISGETEAVPSRWTTSPGFKDYATQKPLSRKDIEQMIDDYYKEQGWDRHAGMPKPDRMRELGLTGFDL